MCGCSPSTLQSKYGLNYFDCALSRAERETFNNSSVGGQSEVSLIAKQGMRFSFSDCLIFIWIGISWWWFLFLY